MGHSHGGHSLIIDQTLRTAERSSLQHGCVCNVLNCKHNTSGQIIKRCPTRKSLREKVQVVFELRVQYKRSEIQAVSHSKIFARESTGNV
jgi:hypothetical protein